MKMPRIRAASLASALLAGGVAFSAVLGPAMLPADFGGSAARAELVVSLNLFQRELAPYGRWAQDPRYGDVWYPDVRAGWRPYYDDGHWVYSDDYGWLWVADQPWGWAPFHYGRWVLTDYGWAWVPGTVWGPAWVTFRSAPDYIGWAPLPPEADWDDGYGFRHRYAVDDDRYWTFVRPRGFLERRFDRYVYHRRDNRRFIQHTTNITNITIINNRVVNRGIDVNHVERETHRRVHRVRVTDSDRPDRTRIKGNNVVIYKPVITGRDRDERLNSGSVTNDEQGNVTNKRKRRGNLNVNQGSPAQQFVAPSGQAGDTDQLPTRKRKKRNSANVNQQQFTPESQMQPSAGGSEPERLPVKKKKKRSANINGGAQQPETFFQNNGGAPEGTGQVPRKKKRQKQQFGNQQQQFEQPQVQRQQRQQQDQQNTTKRRQKKQNNRQCQQGDAGACN
jgi:Family of unknown function (DUF6600)